MPKDKVIAIDGPCGSGKSSVAKKVATSLGVIYIDTGAMFRALGYCCHKNGIPFEEGKKINDFLNDLDLKYAVSDDCLIEVNGENLTETIRDHSVSALASGISIIPSVRTFLLNFQRKLAAQVVCIMEGRDIGTVVFPNAFCKIYLTEAL